MTLTELKGKYHLTAQEIREALDAGFKMEDMLELYHAEIIERQHAAVEAEDDMEPVQTVQTIGVPKPNGKAASVLPPVLPAPVAVPRKAGRPKGSKNAAQSAVPLQLPNGIKVNRNAVYREQVRKVLMAIQHLRQFNTPSAKGITSKGVHVVYSHFNEIMPEKLGVTNVEPTWELRKLLALMAQNGDIGMRPAKGGPMIYLPQDTPTTRGVSLADAQSALANL